MPDSIDFIYNLIQEKGLISLSDCDGCCPCGHLYIRGINFDFHCWRGSCNQCKYSGIHLSSHHDFFYSREDLEKLGKLCLDELNQRWDNTDWELVIEENKE